MKRSLLILIYLSAFAINLVNAQCTPNLTGPYGRISPDTTANLPHDTVGHTYNTVIQLFVPADTVYNSQTVPIDSIDLTSVFGMPGGFVYNCNPSTCHFPGNTAGCVDLNFASPTPLSDTGTHPLTIYVTVYVHILGNSIPVPDTIHGYKIVVVDTTASGIPVLNPMKFELSQNFPNPVFSGNTEIDYSTPTGGKMSFNVYNMLGQSVITRTLNAKQGINQIFIGSNDLAAGIYMYSLNNGTQTITKRMVVGSR